MADNTHNEKYRDAIDERQKELKAKFLDALEENPNIAMACKKVGLARATPYRWIKDDLKFSDKWGAAKIMGRDTINDFVESKLLKQIQEEDPTAIRYYLSRVHPEYQQKSSFERDQLREEVQYQLRANLHDFLSDLDNPKYKENKYMENLRRNLLGKIMGWDEEGDEDQGSLPPGKSE